MSHTPDTLAYVEAAAELLGLPLPPDQALRVATHLERTRALVAPLMALPLADDDEIAAFYLPAPFPESDPS